YLDLIWFVLEFHAARRLSFIAVVSFRWFLSTASTQRPASGHSQHLQYRCYLPNTTRANRGCKEYEPASGDSASSSQDMYLYCSMRNPRAQFFCARFPQLKN